MKGADDTRADAALRHRKTRDRAIVLPLVGLILLTPPGIGIFQLDGAIAGVPVVLVYLFTVWALLIAGAAALSRRLRSAPGRRLDAAGPGARPGPTEAAD